MPQNDAPRLYRIQDKRLVITSPNTPTAEICFGMPHWKPQRRCCKPLGATVRFLPEILAGHAAKF